MRRDRIIFLYLLHLPGLFQISAGDLIAGLMFWPVLVCGIRFYWPLTLALAGWLDHAIWSLDAPFPELCNPASGVAQPAHGGQCRLRLQAERRAARCIQSRLMTEMDY